MLQGFRGFQFGGQCQVYSALAKSITSMAAYSATAGVGGPLLWNGTNTGGTGTAKGVTAYILAVGYGITTASTVAGSIGVAVGSGQSSAPTSTTGITLSGNINPLQTAAQCSVYNVGTVANAASSYIVTGQVETGATTTGTADDNFVHLGGLIAVPPGCWAAVVAGETLTSAVLDCSLLWLEIAND